MRTARFWLYSVLSEGCLSNPRRPPSSLMQARPRCRPPTPPGCSPLWSCDLWCMLGSQPPSPDRMTDACENITLPRTSFVGGKNPGVRYNTWVDLIWSSSHLDRHNRNQACYLFAWGFCVTHLFSGIFQLFNEILAFVCRKVPSIHPFVCRSHSLSCNLFSQQLHQKHNSYVNTDSETLIEQQMTSELFSFQSKQIKTKFRLTFYCQFCFGEKTILKTSFLSRFKRMDFRSFVQWVIFYCLFEYLIIFFRPLNRIIMKW